MTHAKKLMLDFTKQISLDQKNYGLYKKLRAVLYLLAFLFAVYFAYLILFPSASFTFDFSTPNSLKNTVADPRDHQGNSIERGEIKTGEKMIFDTALSGNYGKAQIELSMDKQSENPEGFSVQAKKSYRAFLYPDKDPVGFKDGTLLASGEKYYTVSNGTLRIFSDNSLVEKMGYDISAFFEISEKDLGFNPFGEPIRNASSYPDNAIFKINNEYYILYSGKLRKFISENAFLSQYEKNMAISKDSSLLETYPIDETQIGFSNGTLLSYGISAYIVSYEKLLPINNTVTFITMGYDWNDIKPASADEISFYEKGDLFKISGIHPDGTIFSTIDTGENFIIEKEFRRIIPTNSILRSWKKNKPIAVSSKSTEIFENCQLKKKLFPLRTYYCEADLQNIGIFLSNNYEFYLDANQKIMIDAIDVTFKKQVNWKNMKDTLSSILSRIKINYGIETSQQI